MLLTHEYISNNNDSITLTGAFEYCYFVVHIADNTHILLLSF